MYKTPITAFNGHYIKFFMNEVSFDKIKQVGTSSLISQNNVEDQSEETVGILIMFSSFKREKTHLKFILKSQR